MIKLIGFRCTPIYIHGRNADLLWCDVEIFPIFEPSNQLKQS